MSFLSLLPFSQAEDGTRDRSHLHELRAGHDGWRRLADVRMADARFEAVCRGNIFSTRRPVWAGGISAHPRTGGAGVAERPAEDRRHQCRPDGAVAFAGEFDRCGVGSDRRLHRGQRLPAAAALLRFEAWGIWPRAQISAALRAQFPPALLETDGKQ